MAQTQESLQRQLENAQSALSAYESRRESDKPTKTDPHWRKLDAARRNAATRLQKTKARQGNADESGE